MQHGSLSMREGSNAETMLAASMHAEEQEGIIMTQNEAQPLPAAAETLDTNAAPVNGCGEGDGTRQAEAGCGAAASAAAAQGSQPEPSQAPNTSLSKKQQRRQDKAAWRQQRKAGQQDTGSAGAALDPASGATQEEAAGRKQHHPKAPHQHHHHHAGSHQQQQAASKGMGAQGEGAAVEEAEQPPSAADYLHIDNLRLVRVVGRLCAV